MTDELEQKREQVYGWIFSYARDIATKLDYNLALPQQLHKAIDGLIVALRVGSGEEASPVQVIAAADLIVATVKPETILPRNLHNWIAGLEQHLDKYRLAIHEIEQRKAYAEPMPARKWRSMTPNERVAIAVLLDLAPSKTVELHENWNNLPLKFREVLVAAFNKESNQFSVHYYRENTKHG